MCTVRKSFALWSLKVCAELHCGCAPLCCFAESWGRHGWDPLPLLQYRKDFDIKTDGFLPMLDHAKYKYLVHLDGQGLSSRCADLTQGELQSNPDLVMSRGPRAAVSCKLIAISPYARAKPNF